MSRIYALFWRTFFKPERYVGVPNMTIISYVCDPNGSDNMPPFESLDPKLAD